MDKTIILSPQGGLANRMRAITAAYELAKATKHKLRVLWVRDSGLNARFDQLFEPTKLCEIEEVSCWKRLAYVPPRKKNLFIPLMFQRGYGQVFYDPQLTKILSEGNQRHTLPSMIGRGSAFIASGLGFFPADDKLFRKFFIPKADIREEIERRTAKFHKTTVGIHIRRTDNKYSIKNSPFEFFIKRMRELKGCQFYLATDDEIVRRYLVQAFSGRILSSTNKASRNSIKGMKEAVCELFTLANTDYFLGSYYSSFSDLVLAMGTCGEIISVCHTERQYK